MNSTQTNSTVADLESMPALECPGGHNAGDECHVEGCFGGLLVCECNRPAQLMRQIGTSTVLEPICATCVRENDGSNYRYTDKVGAVATWTRGGLERRPVIFARWVALLLVLGGLALGGAAHAAPAKHKAPPVTHIDMSGPSAPESDFPTIAKKGPL